MKAILVDLFLTSCASAPSKLEVSNAHISGSATGESYEAIQKGLTLGDNQLTAGYSAEVTLYTEPLLAAEATEKGKMNMDSNEKIKLKIQKSVDSLVKTRTCFMFSVHTYTIERAKFSNWVSKVKDSSGVLKEVKFSNTSGVQSVPSTGADTNGRNWHNSSVGCTESKIDMTSSFTVYLIPQIKNNANENETTVLTWNLN